MHETLSGPATRKPVSALLNKLLIEQTKSHSNDNGLAETKNGWMIRKHIGWGHIASRHAEAFDQFYRSHFNPYLNFHRPCGAPDWYATPWEILSQLQRPGGPSALRCHAGKPGPAGAPVKRSRRGPGTCKKPNKNSLPAFGAGGPHEPMLTTCSERSPAV